MRVGIHKDGSQELREVYNPITLVTNNGEELSICMSDSGFEFTYQGKRYFAKEGTVQEFLLSERGNILVDQEPKDDRDVVGPGAHNS